MPSAAPSPNLATPALFGWVMPPAQEAAISFASPQEAPPQAARWSLDLPADAAAAAETLARRERDVEVCRLALEALPGRFEALAGQPLAFAVTANEKLSLAEIELLHALNDIELDAATLSYAPAERSALAQQAASQQLGQLLAKLQHTLLHLAWVETRLEGQRLGWTVIDWLGDMVTACDESASARQLAAHGRALALALRERAALLQAVLITLQGAAKLATLLSAPGGQLLALPATWQYINRVLAEVSQYQQLRQQAETGGQNGE